jgi:hypothetical protein
MANENPMERFVRKTRELFAKEQDPEKRWTALSPVLTELLNDAEVREASKGWPETVFRDGRAENLLFYEDPDYGFAINGTKGSGGRAGQRSLIHDHAHIYTLYGLLDGHQRLERYERVDDRSKPDYAEIRKTSDRLIGPGDMDLAKPYEVHAEVNIGEPTATIIVRSQKGGGFNQGRYDPETNRYWESLGPRQMPVEMLPKKAAAEPAAR